MEKFIFEQTKEITTLFIYLKFKNHMHLRMLRNLGEKKFSLENIPSDHKKNLKVQIKTE